jgi:hypothetical protein
MNFHGLPVEHVAAGKVLSEFMRFAVVVKGDGGVSIRIKLGDGSRSLIPAHYFLNGSVSKIKPNQKTHRPHQGKNAKQNILRLHTLIYLKIINIPF